jgi:hypothetical protein
MLQQKILTLIADWPAYKFRKTTDGAHPIHKLIHDEIPQSLKAWTPSPREYKFQGSDGQGNILAAPWVAVFNRNITESATKGYYLVYLLSEDLQRLVLEVGFGATQFEKRFGRGKKFFEAVDGAVINMRLNSNHLLDGCLPSSISRTNVDKVHLDSSGDFRLKAYEHCAIYSLTYKTSSLPSDEVLKRDFLEYLSLYDRMANSLLLAEVDDYVLETAEPPKASEALEISEFAIRPKKKTTKASDGSRGGGNYRRSKKSDKIGRLGEEFIFEYEKAQLIAKGCPDLAANVIFHREDAIHRTPGWDITSYFEDGRPKYIEVKSSEGDSINDIILTRNEWDKAQDPALANSYFIYLVTNITNKPRIEILKNPANYIHDGILSIEVESYSLSLRQI